VSRHGLEQAENIPFYLLIFTKFLKIFFTGYNCILVQMNKFKNKPEFWDCGKGVGTCMDPAYFKALGDPGRVAILSELAQCPKPCTVTEVANKCPVDVSVVSRHLAILRDAGILKAEKRGKQVYYSVRFSDIANTLREMADAIDKCCPSCCKKGD
jgi:ArsR family transcriptional regulator, arsenate/arsenite/antimonite-responsive transcriptional repressor